MTVEIYEIFESIITRALREALEVRLACPTEEYLAGLVLMREHLDDTIETVRMEMRRAAPS